MISKFTKLPSSPGVYFFEKGKTILYIGKSLNLKARILSHLESAKYDFKEKALITNADSVRFIITDSEFKALILEATLIQKYHPMYNMRWKDGKSFLYIKVTIKDQFPKIYSTRKENDHKSLYFGPFSSHKNVDDILRQIRKIFPYCSQKKLVKTPCFYSKIGLCDPCPSEIVTVESKRRGDLLKGTYRKNIRRITKILQGNIDMVEKQLSKKLQSASKKQEYEEALILRNKLFMFQRLLTHPLSESHDEIDPDETKKSTQLLLTLLNVYFPRLKKLHRIECYDISSLSQSYATASMVVMKNGFLDKKQYRKFKIKNLKLKGDFQMLEEVIRRRFRNSWGKPDLIIFDGGKPQIRTMKKTLRTLRLSIPIIGLAKNPDRIIIGDNPYPTIRPKMHDLGFHIVRKLRDESHRFARKYHLFLRSKTFLSG